MAVPIALGGALFLGGAFVVQQHAAAEEPPEERLSFRLLVALAHRPLWLGGIAVMIVGQLLGATALGEGTLALVEPVLAINLVVALWLSALWRRCHLGLREWLGAAALVAGLAAFIVAGDPHGGSSRDVSLIGWVIAGGSLLAVAGGLVYVAKKAWAPRQATMLAGAAGILYGLQDALTTRTIAGFSRHVGSSLVNVLTSWPAYTLVAVAVVALMLAQSAFEAAPLDASLPAITAAEPVTAIGLGAGLYDNRLDLNQLPLAIEMGGLFCMVLGVYLVATSDIVAGPARGPGYRDGPSLGRGSAGTRFVKKSGG
ncbi:MAG: DMT family transporter [Acidimicrobiales bacterium]